MQPVLTRRPQLAARVAITLPVLAERRLRVRVRTVTPVPLAVAAPGQAQNLQEPVVLVAQVLTTLKHQAARLLAVVVGVAVVRKLARYLALAGRVVFMVEAVAGVAIPEAVRLAAMARKALLSYLIFPPRPSSKLPAAPSLPHPIG